MLAKQETGTDTDVFVLSEPLFREVSLFKTPTGIMALVWIPLSSAIPVVRIKKAILLRLLKRYKTPATLAHTPVRRCCGRKQRLLVRWLR